MLRPAVMVAALAVAAASPAHADPNGLFRQMEACLAEAVPATPCTIVDKRDGYVVIKDDNPAKPAAWLIVPDTEVTGIEDPKALVPPVAGFWADGWSIAGKLLSVPPQDIGLAINSKAGRSQNLLHIHISCVLPAVRDALDGAGIGAQWASAPFVRLGGDTYNARKVETLDVSPFLLLRQLPGASEDMAEQSLAVIGSRNGGYYLVTDSTEPGVVAEAEALLDETCGRPAP